MIRIKSLRAGIIIITDAGLKLKASQVASVETISPQTQGLIDKGYLVQLTSGEEPSTVPAEKPAQPKTSHKDSLLHSYKTDDTLHVDGQIAWE